MKTYACRNATSSSRQFIKISMRKLTAVIDAPMPALTFHVMKMRHVSEIMTVWPPNILAKRRIIKAKGFSDCLCAISDEGVTVIVPDSQLNDTAALVIDDAVTSHYSVDYDKISLVGAK